MAIDNTLSLNPPIAPSFDHLPTFKRWLMSVLARIRHGKLTIHLDGERYVVGETDELHASIHLHHPLRLALQCRRNLFTSRFSLAIRDFHLRHRGWSAPRKLAQVI